MTSKSIEEHPTVLALQKKKPSLTVKSEQVHPSNLIREKLLELGAADVGFVEIERESLAQHRESILGTFPETKSIISFVVRMNRESVRNPARSLANSAFHHANVDATAIGLSLTRWFEDQGVRALNVNAGFPMEAGNFPNKRVWTVSHKPLAVAAGLGRMGLHRNVIHPKFGNFILLGSILTEVRLDEYTHPIDYNPCLDCKLCVAACPVGAINQDGYFNFSACMTHNYREFMGGFQDWVDSIVESQNQAAMAKKFSSGENASMWQSLSFGANYKAAYCMAVCPAGEDVITPFLDNRAGFVDNVLKPLQRKEETIYVVANSDAERFVRTRFPHKKVKMVRSGIKSETIEGFRYGLRLVFQPGVAGQLNAVYHFQFTGKEQRTMTVTIRDRRVTVEDDLHGKPDLKITADSDTWLRFLANRAWLPVGLLSRKITLKGDARLLLKFGACFVT
jgi:NAD-dependent dihydropyrimidine dehydrogenase PreA subunit